MQQQTEPSTTSSSAVEVIYVQPSEIQPYWDALEPLMVKVVEGMHGRHSIASLLQDIMQGEIQVWAVVIDRKIKAVIGTHLQDYPTGVRTCSIVFAGGSGFRRWVDQVLEVVEEYARFEGCTHVDSYSRKGWARYMPEYKMSHVHMVKELD